MRQERLAQREPFVNMGEELMIARARRRQALLHKVHRKVPLKVAALHDREAEG